MENSYLNAIGEAGRNLILYISVADGPLAVDELSVTRQPVTWQAPVNGNISIEGEPEFEILGGSTVNHVQYWSAVTGGTFYGSSPVTPEAFGGDGTYVLSSATIEHNVPT